MSLRIPRILIIDDKEEEGTTIAKALWDSKYAVRYIKYDPKSFLDTGKEKLMGVRVVFMDIDLIGDGVFGSGSKNFSAIQQALEYCLDEKNGPYILITWSTFDAYANDLFRHLNDRITDNLKPVLYKRLNKEDYKGEKRNKLSIKIEKYLKGLEATGCLIEWERNVQYATCETIFELMNIGVTSGLKSINKRITTVLYNLAKAEAGKNLNEGNATHHLHSMLSQLLYDEITNMPFIKNDTSGKIIFAGKASRPINQWHPKINTMLHLDYTKMDPNIGHIPGDVFEYPENVEGLPIPHEDIEKFIRGKFMDFKDNEEKKKFKSEIKKSCRLLLIEITPPCDFAQNKFDWNRYIVAALIPEKLISLTYILKRKGKSREEGKSPDFRWNSPEFQFNNDSPFRVVFNSRFILSVPCKNNFQSKFGERLFRIRQPLLSDMIGWLARQSSRQGHVSLSK